MKDTNPTPSATYQDLLQEHARGTGLLVASKEGEQQVTVLLRGRADEAGRDQKDDNVQIRAALLTLSEEVALIPVLVCLGVEEDPENLYETWANESEMELADLLRSLTSQKDIFIHLHGEGCQLVRTFRIPNVLQDFASKVLPLVLGTQRLSADAFHQARQAVYQRYPSLRTLWRIMTP